MGVTLHAMIETYHEKSEYRDEGWDYIVTEIQFWKDYELACLISEYAIDHPEFETWPSDASLSYEDRDERGIDQPAQWLTPILFREITRQCETQRPIYKAVDGFLSAFTTPVRILFWRD